MYTTSGYGSLYGSTNSYNLNSFIPQDWRGWNRYENRLARYDVYQGYYHNLAYHSFMSYSESLKVTERLYKHVRGVYNPVRRLVESYVNKVQPGVLDMDNAEDGALPIVTDNEALRAVIIQLWRDSMWQQKKSLFVRNGAMTGDSFIKIVDDIERQQVRLEVLDPAKVKRVEHSPVGGVEYIEIEYYTRDDNGWQTYNEVITPDSFTVTVNGKQTRMFTNARGETLDGTWDNDYGFVPVVHVQHTDVGLHFGAPAFHGSIHKVNELNDLASILNDGMRKQVQLPLIFKNVNAPSTLDAGADKSSSTTNPHDSPRKDSMSALNISGENADVLTLPPTLNVADGLNNVNAILAELERDMPELALHRIREGGDLTAPGVTSAYDDAISNYREARSAYDMGIVNAQRMAVAIGGMRGYSGYRGFNLMSLENDAVDHSIAERPVINDVLSKREKIELTLQGIGSNAPKSLYMEMGWSDTQSDEFIQSTQVAQVNNRVQSRSADTEALVTLGRQVRNGNGQSANGIIATDNAGAAA